MRAIASFIGQIPLKAVRRVARDPDRMIHARYAARSRKSETRGGREWYLPASDRCVTTNVYTGN